MADKKPIEFDIIAYLKSLTEFPNFGDDKYTTATDEKDEKKLLKFREAVYDEPD